MKLVIILVLVLSFLSCGSAKQTESMSKEDTEEYTLPPNTASNKYSKKRKSSGI